MNSTTTSSLASKREPEVVNFGVSTRLPPPPPPSHPNASGGGPFCRFDVPPTTTSSLASKHAGGGLFRRFQGICRRRHITTARKSTTAKMDKRGEADERRASRMIGRDMREEGQGANDDLLVIIPQSSRQWPPVSWLRELCSNHYTKR